MAVTSLLTMQITIIATSPISGGDYQAPTSPPDIGGNAVQFTNPEGITGAWDFGDGTPTTTDIDPSHEYAVHGVYTVEFISDTTGSFTQEITITALTLPTASFTATPRFPVSNTYDFVGSGGTGYEWAAEGNILTGANVSYTFVSDGDQLVSLVVTDSNNNTDYAEELLFVQYQNILPVVDFQYSTNKLVVSFTANATDPDGDDANLTYLWDFGDSIGTSTDENPVYTYLTEEEVTVTLTVTDERGGSTQDVKTFNVYKEYQLGPELMTNPDFATTDVSDFSLSNVSMSIAGGVNTVTATAGGQDFFSFTKPMAIGTRYLCEYRLRNLTSTDGVIKNWVGTEETLREDLTGTMTTYNLIMTADEANLVAYTYATAGGDIGDSIEVERLSFKEML